MAEPKCTKKRERNRVPLPRIVAGERVDGTVFAQNAVAAPWLSRAVRQACAYTFFFLWRLRRRRFLRLCLAILAFRCFLTVAIRCDPFAIETYPAIVPISS